MDVCTLHGMTPFESLDDVKCLCLFRAARLMTRGILPALWIGGWEPSHNGRFCVCAQAECVALRRFTTNAGDPLP